jgi:2-keto-4-pentenoate hydratase/2-oxohepta-3-ene-1,7-dioic acid hydratase in catechol pathway
MTVSRDELVVAVRDVLEAAATGKGTEPAYLTAYQILNRVPAAVRDALVAEYGGPGRGSGQNFSAASRIGQIAADVGEQAYLDTGGVAFEVNGETVAPGYQIVSVFRARRPRVAP